MLLENKKMKLQKQSNKMSNSWRKLDTYNDAWINWNWEVKDISTFIKAFSEPHCGASTVINKNQRLFITKASVLKSKVKFHPFQYGMIFRIDNGCLYVACNKGILKILDFKFEKGKKTINFFLNKKFSHIN